jgi:hypothetical protein
VTSCWGPAEVRCSFREESVEDCTLHTRHRRPFSHAPAGVGGGGGDEGVWEGED